MFSVPLLSSFLAFLIWVFSSLFVGVRQKLFMVFSMPSSGTSSFDCDGPELAVLCWDLYISRDMPGGFQRAQSSYCHHNQLLHCHSCLISLYQSMCLQTSQSETSPLCPCSPAGSSRMSSPVWNSPPPSQSCPLPYWSAGCAADPCSCCPPHPNEQKSSHIWVMCVALVPNLLVCRLLEKTDINWVINWSISLILQCFCDRTWEHAMSCTNATA